MDMETWERIHRITAWSVGILVGLTSIIKNLLDLKDRRKNYNKKNAFRLRNNANTQSKVGAGSTLLQPYYHYTMSVKIHEKN